MSDVLFAIVMYFVSVMVNVMLFLSSVMSPPPLLCAQSVLATPCALGNFWSFGGFC